MAEAQKPPVCDIRIASKGPRFFRDEDGAVMFEIQLDSRSKIGPRAAIDADKHQYPTAWRAFGQAGRLTAHCAGEERARDIAAGRP